MARFVIEELDAETTSQIKSHFVEIEAYGVFIEHLGFDPRDCLANNTGCHLSHKDMRWLSKQYDFKPISKGNKGYFGTPQPYHDLPYRLHANSELWLMLKGEKPMAFFTHEVGLITKKRLQGHQPFHKYVKSGRLIYHICDLGSPHGVRLKVHYYALPGQEWRIHAHVMLMEWLYKRQWNETLERLEGELLGYTDEQNDIHIARKYPGLFD